MSDEIEVEMMKIEVAKAPLRLTALGIGSCMVITLYDPICKIGALAHTMLPDSTIDNSLHNPFKYADLAVVEMIKRLEQMGSKRQELEAKLVGGANMFPSLSMDTGKENAVAVKKKLEQEGIRITGKSIGGSCGRSVEFDTTTGIVTVRIRL